MAFERRQLDEYSLHSQILRDFHVYTQLAYRQRDHDPRDKYRRYALMPEIEELTHGKVRLGPGTLYRSIQRMLVDGLIEELDYPCDVSSDDERHRYYRLTRLGKQVAKVEAERLAQLVEVANKRGFLQQGPGKLTKTSRRRRSVLANNKVSPVP